ncbi:hypothetical protein SAMN00790413_04978 [Deinococcus hopiensis KR-140]|uniref:Uncharacterized protein n=1 Tax=Deinococcus hopiensis KR-140 TaxID=695939 RepID=A0A1W1USN2_9DEIO|nr:hypothetical protein SAMN00790413_04978 [Deinococcus hopiensis KR-140]
MRKPAEQPSGGLPGAQPATLAPPDEPMPGFTERQWLEVKPAPAIRMGDVEPNIQGLHLRYRCAERAHERGEVFSMDKQCQVCLLLRQCCTAHWGWRSRLAYRMRVHPLTVHTGVGTASST